MEKTYYQEFGILENATLADIKKAYRKLAFKYHPDRHRGALEYETIFKHLNYIYQTLSNVESRAKYDNDLRRKREGYQSPPQKPNESTPKKGKGFVMSMWHIWLICIVLRIFMGFSGNTSHVSSSSTDIFNKSSTNNNPIDATPSVGDRLFGKLKPEQQILNEASSDNISPRNWDGVFEKLKQQQHK